MRNTTTTVMIAAGAVLATVAQAATIHVDIANCRPPASDCCIAHGGPGCDDMPCETTVCAIEPSCCTTWDNLCVSLANALCDPLCRGACPGGGTGTELDPFCCIQEGIDAAFAGDEVVIAPGTYSEEINFLAKMITVRSTDPTDPKVVAATRITSPNGTAVTMNNAVGVGMLLDGITIFDSMNAVSVNDGLLGPEIRRCVFTGNGINKGDSALRCADNILAPMVTDCDFIGNLRGGIWSQFSAPAITGCLFQDHTGPNSAVRVRTTNMGNAASISTSVFINNSVNGGEGGGALHSTASFAQGFGDVSVTDCVFEGNSVEAKSAESGGGTNRGGACWGSFSEFLRCTFTNNTAASGGGVAAENSSTSFTDCSFTGNVGSTGAILQTGTGGAELVNTFFCDNGPRIMDGCFTIRSMTTCSACPADVDGDGTVGINDFLDLLAAWGPCQ